MKNIYLLLIFLLTGTSLFAQTYTGDLTLTTQAEVDAFNYDKIVGSLQISGSDIVNIDSLYKLDSLIGYGLFIENTKISDLHGLRNTKSLVQRHRLQVSGNTELISIDDLKGYMTSLYDKNVEHSEVFDTIVIRNNPKLTDIELFFKTGNNVGVQVLAIDNNDNLKNIDFNNACKVIHLYVKNNDGISKLTLPSFPDELQTLYVENNLKLDSIVYFMEIGYGSPLYDAPTVFFKDNPALTYLDYMGFYYMESVTVENNNSLNNLNFLSQLSNSEYSRIGNLKVVNNSSLVNCCAIQGILSRENYETAEISNNPFACNNVQQIIDSCDAGPKNIIYGKIYLDKNNNDQPDESDVFINNIMLSVLVNEGTYSIMTPPTGFFVVSSDVGHTKITPAATIGTFRFEPASHIITRDNYGNRDTVYFKVVADTIVNDASVSMTSNYVTRKDQENAYIITYNNEGGDSYNGKVKLKLDNKLIFKDALPAPNSTSGDTLIWDVTDMPLFSQKSIKVNVTGSGSIMVNDSLSSYVEIGNDLSDATPSNNHYVFKEVVSATYEVNNKSVDITFLSSEAVAEWNYLTYTIRFQNTTNDTVNNVVINDVGNILDWNTFQPLSASHPYTFKRKDNTLTFNFSDIKLPGSAVDETGSRGFLTFKVKYSKNLRAGVHHPTNSANISFDHSEPVNTNTATTLSIGVTAGTDITICLGQRVVLRASGASSYLWSTGATGASISITPTVTTSYFVTGTVGPHQQTDTVTVYVVDNLVRESYPSICEGDAFDFNGNSYTESGTYRDTIPGAFCDSIIIHHLTVKPLPNVDFTKSLNQNVVELTAPDGNDTYSWSLGDGNTSGEQNPVHTYLSTGQFYIVLNATLDDCSATKTDSISIIVTKDRSNISFVNSVKIFPNPANNYLTIDLTATKQATFRISLFSVDGKTLMIKHYNKTSVILDNLNLSKLPAGMYHLRIESEGKQATYNIIRQ